MSTDNVNVEEKGKTDTTWSELIEGSELEIRACREKINALRKSIIFFKKQQSMGVPFPLEKINRHTEIS